MRVGGKYVGEYMDLMKVPVVLLTAFCIVQFIIRVIAYWFGIEVIRILAWVAFAALVVGWFMMLVYISWVSVRRKHWNAMNALVLGLLFGVIGGLVTSVGFTAGNVVALIVSRKWDLFRTAAFSGVGIIFIPLIEAIIGGFVSGVIGLVSEK